MQYNYHQKKKKKKLRLKALKYLPGKTKSTSTSHTLIKKKKRKLKLKKSVIKWILASGLACFLIGVLAFIGMVAWFSRELPDPGKLIERSIPLSTRIYDRTGTHLLYEIHGDQQRTLITLDQIPDYVKNATISVEDKQFYQHKGFSTKGILRSVFANILQGEKAQGGSTITQQFIKNAILSPEKAYTRKLKEVVLAYQLEKNFTKDQILEFYFNEIPYGSTAYGVQSAAEIYFEKSVQDLTIMEGAILAALPQSPTYYSPWGNHRDELLGRAQHIIDVMVNEGYITSEEAEEAKKQEIEFAEQDRGIKAPHFVMYVRQLLTEQYDEKTVEQGGLKVITTLDYDKQVIAEEIVEERGEINANNYRASNASLVSIDAKTGEILAMVGSRDYFNEEIDGNVNVALRKRQPGSSFKPIVYAASFIKGYTPETIVYDVATNFAITGDPYIPKNYTGDEYGPISLRKALAGSLNIAAVKLLYLTGIPEALDLAGKMGYSSLTDPDQYGLTLVLGGGEVSLLEHVAAYSTFAREGVRVEPFAILKIEDKDGKTLQEFEEPQTTEVFDAMIGRQMNDVLSDNDSRTFAFGPTNRLTLPDRPVAAKTGTTNDSRDAWTLGYTPSVVTGVWVGNNDNSPMASNAGGGSVAAPIWQAYMRKTLTGTPVEQFKKPDRVTTGKAMLDGEIGEKVTVTIDRVTGKLASNTTPEELREEKTFVQVHSILHTVNKDDPRGNPPSDPGRDPQYVRWETTVQEWAKKQSEDEESEFVFEEAPTETDDVHIPENIPSISFISPQANDTITGNTLSAEVFTTARRGVSHVEYYLDNQLIESVSTHPFTLNYQLTGALQGYKFLTAKAYDDVLNAQSVTVGINLAPSEIKPTIQWNSPTLTITQSEGEEETDQNATISFSMNLAPGYDLGSIGKVNIFYSPAAQNNYKQITSITNPNNTAQTIPWNTLPQKGDYILYVELVSPFDQVISGSKQKVYIP